MTDNSIKIDGIDIYLHDIYYYTDEFIQNELEIDKVNKDNLQIVKDNFVSMILYIHDHIKKVDINNIELLDSIFDIYIRLCSKYTVLPTLEMFSFLIGIERRTITSWENGQRRAGTKHVDTAKKWFNTCKGFALNRLHNQSGTNANLIFIAKAAYGMAETAPVSQEATKNLLSESREEIAARYAQIAPDQMPVFTLPNEE